MSFFVYSLYTLFIYSECVMSMVVTALNSDQKAREREHKLHLMFVNYLTMINNLLSNIFNILESDQTNMK